MLCWLPCFKNHTSYFTYYTICQVVLRNSLVLVKGAARLVNVKKVVFVENCANGFIGLSLVTRKVLRNLQELFVSIYAIFPEMAWQWLTHWFKIVTILQKTISNQFFVNKNCCILLSISMKSVPNNDKPVSLLEMAWHWTGDKPLFEPMIA